MLRPFFANNMYLPKAAYCYGLYFLQNCSRYDYCYCM